MIAQVLICLIPVWRIKRYLLCKIYGFKIHPSAFIGFSFVYPKHLNMGNSSRIGHGTVCKGLDSIWMGAFSSIGQLNWITGFPLLTSSQHFASQPKRDPRLVVAKHSAITNRHLIDCTDRVVIGEYSIIAGFGSQILTHSVDISLSRQVSAPVTIGKRVFVGTRAVLLPGCKVASCVVVGAGAVVVNNLELSFSLYAGTPARRLKDLAPTLAYFSRLSGYIL